MPEIRSTVSDLQALTRDANGTTTKQIQGYAVMFDTESIDLGGFTEVIKPSALDGVDLSDVKLIYAHENNSILARQSAGNLTTKVDDKGLFFVATLNDSTLANDVYEDINVGNLRGMSFGFTIPAGGDTWARRPDGTLLHTVNKIGEVTELTITAYPAYQDTSVELKRSAEQHMKGATQMADTTASAGEQAPADETPKAIDALQQIGDTLGQVLDRLTALEQAGADEVAEDQAEDTADASETDTAGADTAPAKDTATARDDMPDDDLVDVPPVEEQASAEQRDALKGADKDIKDMPTVITRDVLSEEEQVKRSYIDALKDVNKRDGVTVDAEGAILVPKEILDIQKVPNDPTQLAHYVNRVAVSAPTGTLPILAKATARLVTKAELAKNPELAKASISSVDYKVQTYIGQLPISNEMLADYPASNALVAQYLQDVKSATEEEAIGKILSTKFGSNTAGTLDDLKDAFNALVNYGKDRIIVASVSAYSAIDKLKDNEGRYYVQSDVTAPSGSSLFGAPIVVVADTTLGKAGEANVFVGSLKHAVIEAVRLDGLATSWAQNDYFERVLSVATRFDMQPADTSAGKFFKFVPVAPTAPTATAGA